MREHCCLQFDRAYWADSLQVIPRQLEKREAQGTTGMADIFFSLEEIFDWLNYICETNGPVELSSLIQEQIWSNFFQINRK